MLLVVCFVFISGMAFAEPPYQRYKDSENVLRESESNNDAETPPYPVGGFVPAKEFKLPRQFEDSNARSEDSRIPNYQQLQEHITFYKTPKEFKTSKYNNRENIYSEHKSKELRNENKKTYESELDKKPYKNNIRVKFTVFEIPLGSYLPPAYGPPEYKRNKEEKPRFRIVEESSNEENGDRKQYQKNYRQDETDNFENENRFNTKESDEENEERNENLETEEESEGRRTEKKERKGRLQEESEKETSKEVSAIPYIVFVQAPGFGAQKQLDYNSAGYATYFQQKTLNAPLQYYYQPSFSQPAPYYLPFRSNYYD